MKFLLSLLIASSLTLHAETEKEFGERVAKAWNLKDAAAILALYGDPAKLDPDFKKQITTGMIDFQLKSGFTKAEVTLLPPDTAADKSFVMKGRILYPKSEPVGQVKIAFLNADKPGGTGGGMTAAFSLNPDGTFSLTTPAVETFEWTGAETTNFSIRIESAKAGAFIPEAIVVVEKYGRIDWLTMGKSISFTAHKIISLIISPTPGTESLTVEITTGMGGESVYKNIVNTAKGAIIPIGAPTL